MTITMDTAYLTLATGTVLPMAVNLVTHQLASSRYRVGVLAVLSVAAGVGMSMLRNGGQFTLNGAALLSVAEFSVAFVAHNGLWKPLGLTGAEGWISSSIPGGLGVRKTSMGSGKR